MGMENVDNSNSSRHYNPITVDFFLIHLSYAQQRKLKSNPIKKEALELGFDLSIRLLKEKK